MTDTVPGNPCALTDVLVSGSVRSSDGGSQITDWFRGGFKVGLRRGSDDNVGMLVPQLFFPFDMKNTERPNLPLARVPLFTGLDDATIDDIFSCMQLRHYAAGELICRQGDPSDSLFLLRSGVAQAFLTSLTGSNATTIARLRPGDVIGEVGVVTRLPRSASVIARSDAVVLELARDDVASLLVRHPRCWRTSRKSSVGDLQR
jgi:hypothetical protein